MMPDLMHKHDFFSNLIKIIVQPDEADTTYNLIHSFEVFKVLVLNNDTKFFCEFIRIIGAILF